MVAQIGLSMHMFSHSSKQWSMKKDTAVQAEKWGSPASVSTLILLVRLSSINTGIESSYTGVSVGCYLRIYV